MNPNDVALEIGKRFFFSNCDFYGKPGRVCVVLFTTIIVEPMWGPWN